MRRYLEIAEEMKTMENRKVCFSEKGYIFREQPQVDDTEELQENENDELSECQR